LGGVSKEDPLYLTKLQELEKLTTLAETIKKKSLLNPVVAYKEGENYRLLAGERRFLASLIAKKEDIQARVLNEKPSNLDLRLLQWIENTEREDLSLKDRIGNINAVINEYCHTRPGTKVTATLLKDLLNISLPQATYYEALTRLPKDLEEQIAQGKINSIEKAAILAKISSVDLRKKVMTLCVEGGNIKQMKALIELEKNATSRLSVNKRQGRAYKQVNMGVTQNTQVIQKIVNLVIASPQYKHCASFFEKVCWNEYEQASKAFRKLIEVLEQGEKT
jgi:ParB family chromosome partitioning protein